MFQNVKEQVNGSPGQRPSIPTVGSASLDVTTDENTSLTPTATLTPSIGSVDLSVSPDANSVTKPQPVEINFEEKIEEVPVDSLEKILENKLVRGKLF